MFSPDAILENSLLNVPSSVASPTFVDVPCASINSTVSVLYPDCEYALATACIWPRWLGAVIPLPRPSLLAPMPRITEYIVSLSEMASLSLLSTITPEPSPITNPFAPESNGVE